MKEVVEKTWWTSRYYVMDYSMKSTPSDAIHRIFNLALAVLRVAEERGPIKDRQRSLDGGCRRRTEDGGDSSGFHCMRRSEGDKKVENGGIG